MGVVDSCPHFYLPPIKNQDKSEPKTKVTADTNQINNLICFSFIDILC